MKDINYYLSLSTFQVNESMELFIKNLNLKENMKEAIRLIESPSLSSINNEFNLDTQHCKELSIAIIKNYF